MSIGNGGNYLEASMSDLHPWLEDDDEFEGVGAHPDNPRYDHDTALADQEAAKEPDATP